VWHRFIIIGLLAVLVVLAFLNWQAVGDLSTAIYQTSCGDEFDPCRIIQGRR